MREMAKGSIISCQLNFIPIGTEEYLNPIEEVLSLIKASGLEYTIGDMSTTLLGKPEKIFGLLAEINQNMSAADCNYTMTIVLSNLCGCE